MKYEILISKSAEKSLLEIPFIYAVKIDKAILELGNIPRPNGCKKLKGIENLYRIKINDY